MLAEKNRFGFTHVNVAEQLIRRWRLASFMADAVLYQHHSLEAVQGAHPLVKIVNLAAHLANHAGKLSDPQFGHGKALLGLGNAELIQIVEEADEAIDQAAENLNLVTLPAGEERGRSAGQYDQLARHVRTFALLSAAHKSFNAASPQDRTLDRNVRQPGGSFGRPRAKLAVS